MAEIELNVLTGQCLNRRIDDIALVRKEAAAWQKFRNNKNAKINWQFTAEVPDKTISSLSDILIVDVTLVIPECLYRGSNVP